VCWSCRSIAKFNFNTTTVCVLLARQPPLSQGLLIHEVSRSHTTTYHSRQDSSGRVIGSSQSPLRYNTQHSLQTNIHAPAGIRTHNPSNRVVADPRFRPHGHWDRQYHHSSNVKMSLIIRTIFQLSVCSCL
jgi:hypothetical protein